MLKIKAIKRVNPLTQEDPKFYAAAAPTKRVTIGEISREVSKKRKMSSFEIKAILEDAYDAIFRKVIDGEPVSFGVLGTLRPTIKSRGTENKEDVCEDLIKERTPKFCPSIKLKAGVRDLMKCEIVKD